MKRILARSLLQYTTAELWDILCIDFILVFDDGVECVTTAKEALYSSYFWEFHRLFPKTPLLKAHHVSSVAKASVFTSNTHIDLLSHVYFASVDAYGLNNPKDRTALSKLAYAVVNHLYNDLTIRCEAYVFSLDILDFIGITRHPELTPFLDHPEPTEKAILMAYDQINRVLKHPDLYETNAVARACQFKIVNQHQILQCLGPRGRVTEVDGYILTEPVMRSFTKSLRTLYNVAAESRSATRALYFSDTQLKDAEYFARRLQLLAMSVERLHYVDCGSTNYVSWRVKPPIREDGVLKYPGDLKFLIGKYHLDSETNTLKLLTTQDTHLYGQQIKLRSVLTCVHPDAAGVCAVCFGQLSDNVMDRTNLGHNCAISMTKQTTGSVLGAKHVLASSVSEPIQLDAISRQFFTCDKKNRGFYLLKELKVKKPKLVVSKMDAYGLLDVTTIDQVENLNPARVSRLNYVEIETNSDKGHRLPIAVSKKGHYSMLSMDLLRYVREHGWTIDSSGAFVFDLTYWDYAKPIIILPEMEYSFSRNSKEIAEMIESKMKNIGDRLKPESPVSTLIELFDLVNSKLNVPLALLEVIIYSSMIRNGAENDYGLSRNSPTASLGVAKLTIRNRSASNVYAFEKQQDAMFDPASFYPENRPDSVMDVFIDPKNVLENMKPGSV